METRAPCNLYETTATGRRPTDRLADRRGMRCFTVYFVGAARSPNSIIFALALVRRKIVRRDEDTEDIPLSPSFMQERKSD